MMKNNDNNEKKGILFITHELDIHGASKMLLQLIDGVSDEYRIYVLTPGLGMITEILKEKDCEVISKKFYLDVEPKEDTFKSNILWYIRKIRFFLIRKPYNKKIVKEVSKYVKNNNIKLIHSNSSSISIGIDIAKKTGIKHIWHFREFLKEDFRLNPIVGWKKYLYKCSKSDAIVCVSNSIYLKYKDKINTDIYMIYDGVQNKKIENIRKPHIGINLLQVGVLSKGKGTDIAIKAIVQLVKEGYENVNLYLAGNGDLKFCKADYKMVESHIHLLGFVEDVDKCRLDNNIDVELVCSQSEGFGLVSVEAMSAHNPVIGSNSAGTAELIIDGYNGFLFEKGNVYDLVNKIKNFIVSPKLILTMGENGFQRYIKNYTIDLNIVKIKQLYKNILGDSYSDKKN